MPKEDRYLLSVEELEDQVAIMMGGRAAERVVLGTISTGAVDDIQRATQLARRMVTEFGMSEKLGSVRYAGDRLRYLGGAIDEGTDCSPETRQTIDAEVNRIVGEQAARAEALLTAHRDALTQLAARVLEAESVDGNEVREVLARTKPTSEDASATAGRVPATSPDPQVTAVPSGRFG
jgi:cell division protease FtsH